ncbi:MAG: CocE/NonD family hydrolase, partial [Euryarchaeota archaeon]|nr:CocE/NonD family hydrolase [Euryarchaeota archaeon]
MSPLRPLPLLVVLLFVAVPISGCLSDAPAPRSPAPVLDEDPVPVLDYVPEAPDLSLRLVQESTILPGDGVTIHGRTVRPAGEGPYPVIIQFTPYTAPGRNADLNNIIEPNVHDTTGAPLDLDGSYVKQFVRRGYAFVFADVRGTGDSSGCLDLRGSKDIADQYHLIEHYATQSWSNGKVGFIGASYPGSTSHMAALAGNPHLAAVVPVVASTSFYHYHHNDGVPYNGNHALGGTNSAYTAFATAPTVNPQEPNYIARHIEEAECPHFENMVEHGGMDQTGAYYDWWQDRNLRTLVDRVEVPVLMA